MFQFGAVFHLFQKSDTDTDGLAVEIHKKVTGGIEVADDDAGVALEDVVEVLTKSTNIDRADVDEKQKPNKRAKSQSTRFDDFWESNRENIKSDLEVRKVLKRIEKLVSFLH